MKRINITRQNVFLVLLLICGFSNAQSDGSGLLASLEKEGKPVIQQFTNGKVNWTEQYIEATGEAVIDTGRFKNPAQAKSMAGRGAVVVAQRNLLEIIQGVHINSQTTVKDFMTESDVIKTNIDGVLKGATVVSGPEEQSGLMKVVMRVPLYEGNSLASAVYTPTDTITGNPPLRPSVPGDEQDKPDPSPPPPGDPSQPILPTGDENKLGELFFNLTEGKIDPSLFPEIKDINGNTVLKLMEQYDPTSGKFPKILDISKKTLDKIKKDPSAMVVDIIKDKDGILRVDAKNKERIEKWKNGARDVLGFVKSVLLF